MLYVLLVNQPSIYSNKGDQKHPFEVLMKRLEILNIFEPVRGRMKNNKIWGRFGAVT